MRYRAVYEARREAACGCEKPVAPSPERAPAGAPRALEMRRPCMIHPKASTAALGKREPEALVDIDSDKGLGGGCKPWLKVSRDQEAFEACMAIAEKIGPIDTPKKAFEILKEAIGAEDQEVFGAMYLDTHLYLRGLAETGRGEYDAVMAPLKPTLRLALAEGITGVLVFHCHPTLYSQASDSDIEVTKMFEKACATLDLFFVDHLIVGGRKEFFSFADEGYLK